MPAPLIWTESRDNLLCGLRAEGRSWDAIATMLGISRWAAIERGRLVGAHKPQPPAGPRGPAAESGREPLPPGHPASWGAITAGTLLDGAAYPYPPIVPGALDAGWDGVDDGERTIWTTGAELAA